MTAQVIPLSNQGKSTQVVVLNNVSVSLTTYWNNIVQMWYVDISDDVDGIIVKGLALVPNANLLNFSPQLTETLGQFRVFDIGGEGNATITSLGTTAFLVYFPPGVFESLYPDFGIPDVKPLNFDLSDVLNV